MEDAMILNKASFERGFAHGTVLKCEVLYYAFYWKKLMSFMLVRAVILTFCLDNNLLMFKA